MYVNKLDELKALGDPIEARAADDAARGPAAEELRRLADGYLSVAGSELPAHAHLSADERGTLHKEASEALAWLGDKLALQAQLAKHDEPVLTAADIRKKAGALDRACKPIATKPAPKPAAPAPEAAAGAGEQQQAAADGGSGGGGDGEAAPMDAEEGGGEEPMEAEGAAA